MKNLLTVFAFVLVGGTAMACPNLAGTYTCQYAEEGPLALVITQKTEKGVTVYTLDNQEMIADGATHNMKDEDFDGKYMAVCGNGRIDAKVEGLLDLGDGSKGVLKMDFSLKTTAQGLEQTNLGSIVIDGHTHLIGETVQCHK